MFCLIICKVLDVNAELVQLGGYILVQLVEAVSTGLQPVQELLCVLTLTSRHHVLFLLWPLTFSFPPGGKAALSSPLLWRRSGSSSSSPPSAPSLSSPSPRDPAPHPPRQAASEQSVSPAVTLYYIDPCIFLTCPFPLIQESMPVSTASNWTIALLNSNSSAKNLSILVSTWENRFSFLAYSTAQYLSQEVCLLSWLINCATSSLSLRVLMWTPNSHAFSLGANIERVLNAASDCLNRSSMSNLQQHFTKLWNCSCYCSEKNSS